MTFEELPVVISVSLNFTVSSGVLFLSPHIQTYRGLIAPRTQHVTSYHYLIIHVTLGTYQWVMPHYKYTSSIHTHSDPQ